MPALRVQIPQVSAGVEVQESFKGERVLSLLLPKENLQIARVFDVLQEQRLKDYGILEWSIAQTSLNEVFLRIVEEAEENDALKRAAEITRHSFLTAG